MHFITLAYGLIIGILHYLSDFISLRFIKYKEKILSFGAGISITYLFLELLPQIHEATPILRKISYISLLVGFALFHLVEKYVYQHSKREKIIEELRHIHSTGFFLYHFIIGMVLYHLMENNITQGTLFLIPIVFHSAVSSASFKEIHAELKEKWHIKALLSTSTIMGILIAIYLGVSQNVYYSMLGFVVGALLYIIIKDILPEQKEGDPKYFLAGMIIFVLLLLLI